MRVTGDQSFVVRERYRCFIFEQIVSVAYLKKQLSNMFLKVSQIS